MLMGRKNESGTTKGGNSIDALGKGEHLNELEII